MNITKKLGIAVASLALVGGLGFTSSASAAEDTASTNPLVERICNHIDEINTHFENVAARAAKLTEKLTELRARAEEAGKTELVARIDAKLAKIARHAEHAANKLVRINNWAAEHCDVDAAA